MTAGEFIKELRKQKGLQQKEVAIEVGLNQSNYNKVENNHRLKHPYDRVTTSYK